MSCLINTIMPRMISTRATRSWIIAYWITRTLFPPYRTIRSWVIGKIMTTVCIIDNIFSPATLKIGSNIHSMARVAAIVVLLPALLGPISPCIVPSFTCRLALPSAVVLPHFFKSPFTVIKILPNICIRLGY